MGYPCVTKYTTNKDVKNKGISIGLSKRKDYFKYLNMNTPGVGSYSISGKLGMYGPKYSINNIKSSNSSSNTNDNGKLSRIKSNNKQSSLFTIKENSNICYYKSKRCVIGTERRDYLNLFYKQAFNNPGPGTHNPKYKVSNKSITLAKSQRKLYYNNNNPGPGSYKIPCSLFDYPSYVFGSGNNNKYKYV